MAYLGIPGFGVIGASGIGLWGSRQWRTRRVPVGVDGAVTVLSTGSGHGRGSWRQSCWFKGNTAHAHGYRKNGARAHLATWQHANGTRTQGRHARRTHDAAPRRVDNTDKARRRSRADKLSNMWRAEGGRRPTEGGCRVQQQHNRTTRISLRQTTTAVPEELLAQEVA